MNIQIEGKPFSSTNWYAGIYSTPDGKTYEFTIAVASTEGEESYMLELTWVGDNPNIPEVTDDIWDSWNEYIKEGEV